MHRALSAAALLAATLALAACGAAASPSPSASVAATTATSPSAAATTDASPSESAEATASAGGTDEASGAPSGDLPSFSLPSGAQDLEALLPDEVCGAEALKFSLSGQDFEEEADPEMQAVLDEIGASPSDVSMAVAGSASAEGASCGAGIVRIAGAQTDQIRTAFITATEEQGDTVTEQQLGGRTLYSVESDGEMQHFYFTGDAMVFVTAPEDELEALLAELP